MKLFLPAALLLITFLTGCARTQPEAEKTPEPISQTPQAEPSFVPEVREGFTVEKWADVPDARSLAVSPDGKTVFVGSRSGFVHKVTVTDEGPKVELFQENLIGSNGVCFVGEDLYLAERLRVRKFAADNGFAAGAQGETVLNGLPPEKHHGWRYIRQGPDGRIRMSIGAPCNVCLRPDDPRFATICSFQPDGSDFRIDAKGVRNSVGFDWHPETGDLYFTDNGRDHLGDNLPPCELNRLTAGMEGSHYGFPYYYGDNQPDPEFGDKAPPGKYIEPYSKFQAHVAPLGCYFPEVESLAQALPNQVVVAQHGSWNRTVPIGYRVVTVDLEHPEKDPLPLLWGFLPEDDTSRRFGRPVDIAELPDGTLLVSDDFRGVVWAVRRKSV